MSKHILLIDGDILAYFACRALWQHRASILGGTIETKINVNGIIEDAMTKEEDAEYLKDSWNNFVELFESTLTAGYAEDYKMAVKGEGNYRDDIFPLYKKQRSKQPQPMAKYVYLIRKMAVIQNMAIASNNCEADDLIGHWYTKAIQDGLIPIIASIDKDLKTIGPCKYLNLKTQKIEEVTEKESRRLYYIQMLQGDVTDNIPGIPKVGPKTAERLVNYCKTLEEYQEIVVAEYFDYYGESHWYTKLRFNFDLLHIQRFKNDFGAVDKWPVVRELRK
jgi:5'-3' exonuclease